MASLSVCLLRICTHTLTSVHSQFSTHCCLVLQHGQLVCLSLPYMYSHVDVCTLAVLNSLLSSIATWPACLFVSSVYVLTHWRLYTHRSQLTTVQYCDMASLSVCLLRICTHTCDVCTLTVLNSLLSSIATWPACLFVSSVYVLTRVTSVHSQFSTHYCLVL